MALVDNAAYAVGDRPDLALSRLFVRHDVPETERIEIAHAGIKTAALFRSLGNTEERFRAQAILIWPFIELGGDAEKAVRWARLCAVHEDAKIIGQEAVQESIRLAEDPFRIPRISEVEYGIALRTFQHSHEDMTLHHGCKPHRKFVEKLRRDFIVDRMVRWYELGEILLESDHVQSVPGVTADVTKAIKAAVHDTIVTVENVEDGRRRISALYMGCEMQGICPMTKVDGPLKYLKQLAEFQDKHPGLQTLVMVDKKIRYEFFSVQRESPDRFPTLSAAMLEVLDNQKHLWTAALQEIMTSKAQSLMDSMQGTPRRTAVHSDQDDDGRLGTPIKKVQKPSKKKRLKLRAQKANADGGQQLAIVPFKGDGGKGKKGKGKGGSKGGGAGGGSADGSKKAPPEEWAKIIKICGSGLFRNGKKVCPFYNSSAGCRFGDSCSDLHECLLCAGQKHKWITRHG